MLREYAWSTTLIIDVLHLMTLVFAMAFAFE
jgi:hypothetical protein